MYFTYLSAYGLSCFPCAYVIHFYAFYCLCLYTLRAFVCVNTSGPFIDIAFFKKILVISVLFLLWYQYFFSSCLFSSHDFSAHVFQWFHPFDAVRAQTYLGPKKWIFWKLHWFFFKKTVLNFHYFDILLGNEFTWPYSTHSHPHPFTRKEGKKSTYSFKRPRLLSYQVNPPVIRDAPSRTDVHFKLQK